MAEDLSFQESKFLIILTTTKLSLETKLCDVNTPLTLLKVNGLSLFVL